MLVKGGIFIYLFLYKKNITENEIQKDLLSIFCSSTPTFLILVSTSDVLTIFFSGAARQP